MNTTFLFDVKKVIQQLANSHGVQPVDLIDGLAVIKDREHFRLQLTVTSDKKSEEIGCEYLFTNADNEQFSWSRKLWMPESGTPFIAIDGEGFGDLGKACRYLLKPFTDPNFKPPQDAARRNPE